MTTPSLATLIEGRFTGNIFPFQDWGGVFGPVGQQVSGQPASAWFRYDTDDTFLDAYPGSPVGQYFFRYGTSFKSGLTIGNTSIEMSNTDSASVSVIDFYYDQFGIHAGSHQCITCELAYWDWSIDLIGIPSLFTSTSLPLTFSWSSGDGTVISPASNFVLRKWGEPYSNTTWLSIDLRTLDIHSVPEPTSLSIFLAGLLITAFMRRRQNKWSVSNWRVFE
jgi:hypothetical protein